jgi:hypothetical protein
MVKPRCLWKSVDKLPTILRLLMPCDSHSIGQNIFNKQYIRDYGLQLRKSYGYN